MQQPRRFRALVAHLHVVMGHLSNDRLGRMLMMSGAGDGVVQLAKNLQCQVCAMVRPPLRPVWKDFGKVPPLMFTNLHHHGEDGREDSRTM